MRRSQAEKDAMFDAWMDEKARMEELNSQGLCLSCGDRPQNPEIGQGMCLECFSSSMSACSKNGCPNPPATTWFEQPLCATHLVDEAHKSYEDYLRLKSEVEELKRRKSDLIEVIDREMVDGRPWYRKPENEMTEQEKELQEVEIELHQKGPQFERLKSNLESASRHVDVLFPENYNSPI